MFAYSALTTAVSAAAAADSSLKIACRHLGQSRNPEVFVGSCSKPYLGIAEKHLPDTAGLQQIREALDRARTDLGGEDARVHAIEFRPDSWGADVSLPPTALNRRRISRADGFDATAQPADAEGNWRLFCASFVFGYGTYGIGPSRMARILRRTPRVRLCAVIAEARERLKQCGPLAAYDYLRGKVPYWGPAYFTKLLYFADTPEKAGHALILDNQVAWMIAQITNMRYLVFGRGWSVRWTAYRYGVYLAWMTIVSERLGVPRDFLEYALFKEARRSRRRRDWCLRAAAGGVYAGVMSSKGRGRLQRALLGFLAGRGRDPWPEWQSPAAAAAAIFGTGSSAAVARVRRSAAALAADGMVDVSWRPVFKGLERRGERLHLVRLKPTEAEQAAQDAARAAGFREIAAEIERAGSGHYPHGSG